MGWEGALGQAILSMGGIRDSERQSRFLAGDRCSWQ